MSAWVLSRALLAQRWSSGTRDMKHRRSGTHRSIISAISIYLSVLLFAYGNGKTCGDGCTAPIVDGEGSFSFSPNKTCYNNEDYVNVTCSGTLYGLSEVGPCSSTSGWDSADIHPTCEESSCPSVVAPACGNVSPINTNSLYDEVEFSCESGRFLDGASMAVCTGSGEWSPSAVPVCSGNCSIPSIDNGDVSSSEDVIHEGIQVVITCDGGYTLTGTTNVTCHAEELIPEVGKCLANCQSPIISNSDYATDQGYIDHGEYIIVTCDDGFTSGTGDNVSEPITCSNASLDVDVYCYANCPDISAPLNGNFDSTETPFWHDRQINFTCSDGFTLVGSSTSTCQNGTWSEETPDCLADCLVPTIDNSNLNETDYSVAHETEVTVTCNQGFTFGFESGFNGNLSCDDGYINDTNIRCLANCDSPDVLNSNWDERGDSVQHGVSIVVDCDNGYTSGFGSDTNETLLCTEGSFDPTVYCYENCPSISATNGLNLYPSTPSLYHNNTVYFNCSETYTFVGVSTLVCDNGSWSDEEPECKASCSALVIANSTVAYPDGSGSPIMHGDDVIVICDDDFTSGSGSEVNETVYCDDGRYNPTVVCYENCPDISAIDNGVIDDSGPPHYHGDSANFTCNTNYTLDGAQIVTCRNGEWSPDIPSCKADCQDPGTPANATQGVNSTYTHGGQVDFTCDAGLDILGSGVITCINGNWSDPLPTCAEKTLVEQIRLICDYDSFTVQVPIALLGGLQPDELVLEGNTNCTGVNDSAAGVVNITSKLDMCGTVLEEIEKDGGYYDVYTNRAIAYSPNGVLYGPSVDLPLTCTYDRERDLGPVSYQLLNYTIARSLSEDGRYRYQFLMYDDAMFDDVIIDIPYYVDLGQNVFFGITVQAGGGALRVTATSCWATPSSSSTDSTRWDLVTDSCPKDEGLVFYDDPTRALFSISSFRFLEHDGLVYIHCMVLVCEQDSNECILPRDDCLTSNRRRRRSVNTVGQSRLKRLRAGPFRWINTDVNGLPSISRKEDSVASVQGSLSVYIVVISCLAGFCLVLVACLFVVTTKLIFVKR